MDAIRFNEIFNPVDEQENKDSIDKLYVSITILSLYTRKVITRADNNTVYTSIQKLIDNNISDDAARRLKGLGWYTDEDELAYDI